MGEDIQGVHGWGYDVQGVHGWGMMYRVYMDGG